MKYALIISATIAAAVALMTTAANAAPNCQKFFTASGAKKVIPIWSAAQRMLAALSSGVAALALTILTAALFT